jgi:hypothetical protein
MRWITPLFAALFALICLTQHAFASASMPLSDHAITAPAPDTGPATVDMAPAPATVAPVPLAAPIIGTVTASLRTYPSPRSALQPDPLLIQIKALNRAAADREDVNRRLCRRYSLDC